MDIEAFWKLIDKSRKVADGEIENIPEALKNELMKLCNEDIVAFDKIYYMLWCKACTFELWGVGYIIGGGCSEDSFMDFRAWLIAKGRKVYETGLVNPDGLTKFIKDQDLDIDCQLEDLLYSASFAWEQKTGQEFQMDRDSTICNSPTGLRWSEDDLPKLLPKTWKKFGE